MIIRFLLVVQVLSNYFFERTKGLLYYEGGEIFYCDELFSSGSDDSMIISIALYLYIIPLLVSLVTSNKKVLFYIVLVVYIIQVASYVLIEVCSVFDTIVFGKNILLLIIVVLPIVILYRLKQK